jgi:hypothetical protein
LFLKNQTGGTKGGAGAIKIRNPNNRYKKGKKKNEPVKTEEHTAIDSKKIKNTKHLKSPDQLALPDYREALLK